MIFEALCKSKEYGV